MKNVTLFSALLFACVLAATPALAAKPDKLSCESRLGRLGEWLGLGRKPAPRPARNTSQKTRLRVESLEERETPSISYTGTFEVDSAVTGLPIQGATVQIADGYYGELYPGSTGTTNQQGKFVTVLTNPYDYEAYSEYETEVRYGYLYSGYYTDGTPADGSYGPYYEDVRYDYPAAYTDFYAVTITAPGFNPTTQFVTVDFDARRLGGTFALSPETSSVETPVYSVLNKNIQDVVITSAGEGSDSRVIGYRAGTHQIVFSARPFPGFTGGARVATGDVNGDGILDVAVGAGPGGGPHIKVYDGKDGSVMYNFFPYESSFRGGVNVALGDVNGDGRADIIAGTGVGGGPRVQAISGADGKVLKDFFAYESTFRGGVEVAAGDVDGDGKADIVAGTGVGGGPRIRVFSGATDQVIRDFFAYDSTFRGGVFVAAGDINKDGKADIVAGTGFGGGPRVQVFSGADGRMVTDFFAYDSNFRGGVRVGTAKAADGSVTFTTAGGKGIAPRIKIFSGFEAKPLPEFDFDAPRLDYLDGIYVGP